MVKLLLQYNDDNIVVIIITIINITLVLLIFFIVTERGYKAAFCLQNVILDRTFSGIARLGSVIIQNLVLYYIAYNPLLLKEETLTL